MKVSDLKKLLVSADDDMEVEILAQTYPSGTMGAQDTAGVKWAGNGMDWDRNKFLICPNIKLRAVTFREYNKDGVR